MAKKSKAKAATRAAKKGAKRATSARGSARKTAKKKAAKKKAAKKASAKKSARKAAPVRRSGKAKKAAKATKAPARKSTARAATSTTRRTSPTSSRTVTVVAKKPNLDRERRTIREEEEEMIPSPPSSLNMDRTASAARTGRAEYEQKLREHTSTGPALTGGDVDADWEDAEAVGDEAPGGDNPTPDQDVVDEIGRALGIEYDDDEELKGGDELNERDRHRWELDPASKDDFDED